MFEKTLARPLRLLRNLAAEAAELAETRMSLLYLEWQSEKTRLATLLVLVAAAFALGALSLLFVGLAVIVWFWDGPQRALVATLVAATMIVICGVTVAAALNTIRRGRQAFAHSRVVLAADWRMVRDRL